MLPELIQPNIRHIQAVRQPNHQPSHEGRAELRGPDDERRDKGEPVVVRVRVRVKVEERVDALIRAEMEDRELRETQMTSVSRDTASAHQGQLARPRPLTHPRNAAIVTFSDKFLK